MSAIGSTFRTDEPHLHELLEELHKGQIQLPDFQRGWVWDDDHIRALIASVSLSYLTTLETAHGVKPHRLDEMLRTHLIEPVTLRNDAFETFIRERAIRLLDLIERATGKQVTGRDSDETVAAFGAALVAPVATPGAAVA
jgi:hypothetical protein